MTTAATPQKTETTPATYMITISGPGKPITAQLPKREAEAIGTLVELLPDAPRRPVGGLSAEEVALRGKRDTEATERGKVFSSQLSELAQLSEYDMRLVLAYVQLIRFGDRGLCSEENWILEIVNDLLGECIFSGIGAALAKGPSDALQSLATAYSGFMGSIDMAHHVVKEYKLLFEEHPSAEAGDTMKHPD